MSFEGFTNEDFDVFLIEGLEGRMDGIKQTIRPKLESLGQYFAPILSNLTEDEMLVHVAKHARRTVNPPNNTWVAFANNPRGYKMLPHFEIGLWGTHLFIWFAILDEALQKDVISHKFSRNLAKIYKEIPKDFVWSSDHTKPGIVSHNQLSKKDLSAFFDRLQTVKKAEVLSGYVIGRDQAVQLSAEGLLQQIETVFQKVSPLYKMALNK